MNHRLREYLLREVQNAVLIMERDSSRLHVFDVGKGGGEDLVMLMAVLPRHVADKILPPEMMRDSKPLTPVPKDGAETSSEASPAGKE